MSKIVWKQAVQSKRRAGSVEVLQAFDTDAWGFLQVFTAAVCRVAKTDTGKSYLPPEPSEVEFPCRSYSAAMRRAALLAEQDQFEAEQRELRKAARAAERAAKAQAKADKAAEKAAKAAEPKPAKVAKVSPMDLFSAELDAIKAENARLAAEVEALRVAAQQPGGLRRRPRGKKIESTPF